MPSPHVSYKPIAIWQTSSFSLLPLHGLCSQVWTCQERCHQLHNRACRSIPIDIMVNHWSIPSTSLGIPDSAGARWCDCENLMVPIYSQNGCVNGQYPWRKRPKMVQVCTSNSVTGRTCRGHRPWWAVLRWRDANRGRVSENSHVDTCMNCGLWQEASQSVAPTIARGDTSPTYR
jgi:hypothetical protein